MHAIIDISRGTITLPDSYHRNATDKLRSLAERVRSLALQMGGFENQNIHVLVTENYREIGYCFPFQNTIGFSPAILLEQEDIYALQQENLNFIRQATSNFTTTILSDETASSLFNRWKTKIALMFGMPNDETISESEEVVLYVLLHSMIFDASQENPLPTPYDDLKNFLVAHELAHIRLKTYETTKKDLLINCLKGTAAIIIASFAIAITLLSGVPPDHKEDLFELLSLFVMGAISLLMAWLFGSPDEALSPLTTQIENWLRKLEMFKADALTANISLRIKNAAINHFKLIEILEHSSGNAHSLYSDRITFLNHL